MLGQMKFSVESKLSVESKPKARGPDDDLKVFVACDDFYAQRRIFELLQRIGRESGPGNMVCSWWSFEELIHEDLRNSAGMEALQADLVILSTRFGSELPGHIWEWANRWARVRPPWSGALVGVSGVDPTPPNIARPLSSQLQRLAELGRMDFFMYEFPRKNRASCARRPQARRPHRTTQIETRMTPANFAGMVENFGNRAAFKV